MHLYIAGNVKDKGSAHDTYSLGVRNRLLSYAFKDDWSKDDFVFWVDQRPSDARVFLDSGAFSAHTLGKPVDLGRYCEYLERVRGALHCYAALDGIGDWRGTAVTLRDMRARGLDPIAVFHSNEPYELLEDLAAGHGYIAFGGMASDGATREMLETHLDRCWKRLERHWPVRVHGFGIMAQWALERYPFYSVDSSSAIVAAGMGRVMRFEKGKMGADGWQSYVRRTLDGEVADGVSSRRSKSGTAHAGRRLRNVQAQLALERHVTALWARRGIVWP